jgi:hypothetical protein
MQRDFFIFWQQRSRLCGCKPNSSIFQWSAFSHADRDESLRSAIIRMFRNVITFWYSDLRPQTLRKIGGNVWEESHKEHVCLRWVHTCNVTAYRNAVTLQVTDTIRSYELNFHPVPRGLKVSYERYTLGFPVCYGSQSDVFAASSGFVHLYILRFKEKEKRADGGDVSRCTSTPAQALTISSPWCDDQIPTAYRTSL